MQNAIISNRNNNIDFLKIFENIEICKKKRYKNRKELNNNLLICGPRARRTMDIMLASSLFRLLSKPFRFWDLSEPFDMLSACCHLAIGSGPTACFQGFSSGSQGIPRKPRGSPGVPRGSQGSRDQWTSCAPVGSGLKNHVAIHLE